MKELRWVCEVCGEPEEETKQIYESTDKLRIINRLLRLGDDYGFIKVNLSSQANEIILRIQVPVGGLRIRGFA